MVVIQNMEELIRDAAGLAKEVFREIHSWPELGNEEFKTVTLIGKKLREMGIGIERPLPTAVVVNIKGTGKLKDHEPRRTLAIRADIDALPVMEEVMVSYRSRRAGVMHACGHDAHTAILLGLAQVLQHLSSALPCNVRLIFQPDEEGKGGAQRLIQRNVLCDVNAIYGFHVKPELPAGTVGVCSGIVHGESRMFGVSVKGRASHGARPELGKDAVYGAAQYITMCQGILSRDLAPEQAGVITFGKISGGQERNILAQQVDMEGIVRGESWQVCDLLSNRMKIIAKGLSQALDISISAEFEPGYKALVNDDSLVERIRQAAPGNVAELSGRSMTVDDFSFYLQHVPGAYFFLGSGFEDRENSGLHTGSFQVNEDCLEAGIRILAQLCLEEA